MTSDDMFGLVVDLNDFSIENKENPFVTTSQIWPFEYVTVPGAYASIMIHDRELTSDLNEEGAKLTRQEVIESSLNELESWLPALQSAIWALGKALEKEKAVQVEGTA